MGQRVRRVGVLGTMVWDRIHPAEDAATASSAQPGVADIFEGWGGIGYSLAAFAAARPAGWRIVPIVRIGRDMAADAREFMRALPGVLVGTGVRTVDEPTNRVDLDYEDRAHRCETLHGGVGGWSAEEIAPLLADLDALYINFISGFEMSLDAAQAVRRAFTGEIYADLHSLFMDVAEDGRRVPRPLPNRGAWLECFDFLQVNEDELGLLAEGEDPMDAFEHRLVGDEGVRTLFVTLGDRGARYVTASTERTIPGHRRVDGDPTGCGDVWGATCFARLLGGEPADIAAAAANRAAARNVEHRGAAGLDAALLDGAPA